MEGELLHHPPLFDTHAHYDDKRFHHDRDGVLRGLKANGIGYVVNVGCDLPSSRRSVALAEEYDFVWASVGVHPHNADDMVPRDLDELEGLLRHPKVVALGEIGLDYHYDHSPRMVQMERFADQLALAEKHGATVVVHEREATRDCLDILRRYDIKNGVFHCFSGSVETAAVLIDWGWHLSFTGVLTYSNARKAREVAARIPRNRLMLETDCPYMAPEPHRGKRCDSALMIHTLAALARLWEVTPEEAAQITTQNARNFFGIETSIL